jgi:hypothetical protein
MSLRPDPTDPAEMTAEEGLDKAAGIFARGILRLHGRVLSRVSDAENLPECPPTCIEPSVHPRPDGVAG